MMVLHTNEGCLVPVTELKPLGTVMVFDQTELYLVEHILSNLVAMWDGEKKDEFYFELRKILSKVSANNPETLQ